MNESFRKLQDQTGTQFRNLALLRQAFMHTSYVNENSHSPLSSNERLEFLGDAVLQLTVSEYLYKRYPRRPEGELTRMRASIVCESSLVRFAEALDFGEIVLLGKGEEQTGGRMRPSLLADAFEAFVGALYLDQGLEAVRQFLSKHIFPLLSEVGMSAGKDFKSLLQEQVQMLDIGPLAYRIVEERGPAHDREFVAVVHVGERQLGSGSGRSKKDAEQRAAAVAIESLAAESVRSGGKQTRETSEN